MIYLKLFLEFFKIGLFTFGGGYAMIPLVKEAVLTNGWLSENRFYDFIGVCESTPGPIAVNMATYIGSVQGGLLGSIVATLAVILPSFIIILLIASILKKIIKNKYIQYFLSGIKPVVIGLILSTGITLVVKSIGTSFTNFSFDLKGFLIFMIITILYLFTKLVFKKKINSIILILLSSVLGIVICLFL